MNSRSACKLCNQLDGEVGWKVGSSSMRFWDWHGSMSNTYTDCSPFKALFDDEYDRMFVELNSAQETETTETADGSNIAKRKFVRNPRPPDFI